MKKSLQIGKIKIAAHIHSALASLLYLNFFWLLLALSLVRFSNFHRYMSS